MKPGKILGKLFKKGSKSASAGKGKAGGAFEWPSGVRIGVFGHTNSGKTVSYTVLNEECKISRDLQLSVTDNATAGEFLRNYRALWGLSTSDGVGTMVDLQEEKKFPDETKGDKLLKFTAIIDRKQKLPVIAYDYPGKAVSISAQHELSDKTMDFMANAAGILFYFDPKVLGAVMECQAHVASFVNLMDQLAPHDRSVPVPIGLVITKADVLPGFSDNQTVLINPQDENFLAEDYELFLEKVLTSNRIASDTAWAGTVRDILVKLREFLKVVVGRSLDFQIFFTSNTGQPPEKIGTDVGRSIYAPPNKISPVGVREPFYWLLKSTIRNRRIARFRKVAKYVTILSLIWIGLFSLPNLYHFNWKLNRTTQIEDNILAQDGVTPLSISKGERNKITNAYRRYKDSWMSKWLFERFQVPARRIAEYYRKFNINEARQELEGAIKRLAAIIGEPTQWPTYNPSGDTLILSEVLNDCLSTVGRYRSGDEKSELYGRSDRVMECWGLFAEAIKDSSNADAWSKIVVQVESHNSVFAPDLSTSEKALGKALTEVVSSRQQEKDVQETVRTAVDKFATMEKDILNNRDPEYRFVTAVRELRKLKKTLAQNPDKAGQVKKIDGYLHDAEYFNENRMFEFTLTFCPEGHHLHVLVKKKGQDRDWPRDQVHPNQGSRITWRKGDHIVLALDANNHDHNDGKELWGESPKARKELKSDYSIYGMDGDIKFPTGETITISFEQNLRKKLPTF